jgi:c-di-GMP-binding flagellar brake protein YcgR
MADQVSGIGLAFTPYEAPLKSARGENLCHEEVVMSFLDKLFKRGARLPEPSTAADTGQTSSLPARKIPEHYLPLLELQNQRQFLEVRITGANRIYQSMILAIDVERGLLWLDDLFPQQLLMDAGDEITLRHHRNGELLVIRAPVVAMGSTYQASGFAIPLPEFVYYSPRRSSPRYIIGHQSTLSVKIRTLGQEPSYGTLQDISTGGLRLIVAGNMLPYLRHGALLPMCEVDINDELQIRCRARICAFRIGRSPYRHTQISVEFIGLEEETSAKLARFLRDSQLHHSELYAPQSISAHAA